jgi:hypothetical protein
LAPIAIRYSCLATGMGPMRGERIRSECCRNGHSLTDAYEYNRNGRLKLICKTCCKNRVYRFRGKPQIVEILEVPPVELPFHSRIMDDWPLTMCREVWPLPERFTSDFSPTMYGTPLRVATPIARTG